MYFEKRTLTSAGIIISHGPLDRKQTEQESNSGRPSTGAVYDALTPKHITGRMHFTAGSGREEDDYDDCRKVSEVESCCNYREPTAGRP